LTQWGQNLPHLFGPGNALKIIKLGMDTKQLVARFEAERQALVSYLEALNCGDK